jgi:hypothetical protein
MEGLLNWGVEVVLWFQQFSLALDLPFKALTFMGNEAFYLLGASILFGLWGGLRIAFSTMEPAALLRFIRYTLVGLWGGFGAPWLFVRLKLAETE